MSRAHTDAWACISQPQKAKPKQQSLYPKLKKHRKSIPFDISNWTGDTTVEKAVVYT